MKLAALVSGGKDSMLALYRMHNEGHEIMYLLSMEPESTESYMFHHPNIWITELISETTGIPLLKSLTHGRKEEELDDLKLVLQGVANEVDGIVSGALASRYQKTRIDSLCNELMLHSLAPLWQVDAEMLWNELLTNDFEVLVTVVAAEGLGKKWLGRIIDKRACEELKEISRRFRFHLGFEGGEAETLVLNMPLYKRGGIVVKEAESIWDGLHGSYLIKDAEIMGLK
jgi:ABC transporter with metal-binding/Fe-S-binding domain ATP-binding protein